MAAKSKKEGNMDGQSNTGQPTERVSNKLNRVLIADSKIKFTKDSRFRGALLGAAFVLAMGFGGYFTYKAMNPKSQNPSLAKPITKEMVTKESVDLDSQARKGDVDGALRGFDSRIEVATDPEVRRELLVKKSVVALNHGKLEVSETGLKEAEKIKGGHKIWGLLAATYEKQGRYDDAAEHYEKAADDTTTPNFSANRYYKKAEEMRAK